MDPVSLRLSEDAGRLDSSPDGGEPAVPAVRGHPAPACIATGSRRRCAAAGTPPSYLRDVWKRMRAIAPDIADPHDLHRRIPRRRGRRVPGAVRIRPRGELDNVGAFTYSPEPGSGSEPLGDPVPSKEKERRKRLSPVAAAAHRAREDPGPGRTDPGGDRRRARRRSTSISWRGGSGPRPPRSTAVFCQRRRGPGGPPGEIVSVRIAKPSTTT